MSAIPPTIKERLAKSVQDRTGRRVLNLLVDVDSDKVLLRGMTDSYHVKQLALSGVRDLLPNATLRNEIVVAN